MDRIEHYSGRTLTRLTVTLSLHVFVRFSIIAELPQSLCLSCIHAA